MNHFGYQCNDDIIDNYKVDSLEIIVKDADKTSLQVIDRITRSEIQEVSTPNFVYNYTGTSPFQTLPESERAAKEVLSLAVHPALSNDELEIIVSTVNNFFK